MALIGIRTQSAAYRNMAGKTILFIVSILILIAFGVGYWLTGTPAESVPTPTVQAPTTFVPVAAGIQVGGNGGFASSTSMAVGGSNGGSIVTKNIQSDPALVKDPINPGLFYLGYHINEGMADASSTENPPYIIAYTEATQFFTISVLQEPIGVVRGVAEQYLMSHLGISQDQMCKLNYTLSVPNSVSSQYAGMNLGFSFCRGATPLPQ